MRWDLLLLGLVMLASAVGISVVVWDTKLNPRYAQKADNLRKGMTRAEVEAVMGGEGEPGMVFISGSMSYWKEYFRTRETYARQWEDADTKVSVTFEGLKGEAAVQSISQSPNTSSGCGGMWLSRILLSSLAMGGLGLVVFGLCPLCKQPVVDAMPTSSPPV